MKSKIILTTLLSILVGLYIALHHNFISGTNPFLGKIFTAIMIGILIWNLILIFKDSDKKSKLIQLSILILAIVIGLYKAKTDLDSFTGENPRIYYQTDTALKN